MDTNLYRYCGNNPINNVDPAGLDKQFLTGVSSLTRSVTGDLVSSFTTTMRMTPPTRPGELPVDPGITIRATIEIQAVKDGAWVQWGKPRLSDTGTMTTGPTPKEDGFRIMKSDLWDCKGNPKIYRLRINYEHVRLDGTKLENIKLSIFKIVTQDVVLQDNWQSFGIDKGGDWYRIGK